MGFDFMSTWRLALPGPRMGHAHGAWPADRMAGRLCVCVFMSIHHCAVAPSKEKYVM